MSAPSTQSPELVAVKYSKLSFYEMQYVPICCKISLECDDDITSVKCF